MLLADLDGDFVLKALLLANLVVGIGVGVKSWFGGSQKREVTINPDAVAKPDFDKFAEWNAKEHTQLFAKVGGVERGCREQLQNEMAGLHTKVNTVDRSLAAVETECRLQTKTIDAIARRLDVVPAVRAS